MRVLLVNPPAPSSPREVLDAPLGLGYIAAVLEEESYAVSAIDMAISDAPWEFLDSSLKSIEPDIVGITSVACTFDFAKEIARICKKRDSLTITVLGGVHVTLTERDLSFEIDSNIDYVVLGEGECTFLELVKALERGCPLEQVKGITFWDNECSHLMKTADRDQIRSLDSLPFPARHLFPMENYIQTHVLSSRGCPYECLFCCSRDFWGRVVRFRSPTNFIDEVAYVISRYGKRVFFVADDTFTLDKERTLAICELILRRKLDLRWSCLTRVDLISEDLLNAMHRAGCVTISFGCEVGTQEELDRLQKGITIQQIKEAIKLTQQMGIAARTSWILGFPWSTSESTESTIELLKQVLPDEVVIYTPVPYPGSRLFENIGRYGVSLRSIGSAEFYSGRKYPLPIPNKVAADRIQDIVIRVVEDLVATGYKTPDIAQTGDKVVTTSFSPVQSFRSYW